MTGLSPILEIRDLLARRGGVTVLDIPALSLRNGEVLSLIGPNGAGKSSLLLAMARLIPTAAGAILFKGQAVHGGSGLIEYRRKIAMVFQEPLLFDTTVRSNVAAGLRLRGVSRDETGRIVKDCLERFGIDHLGERHARKLSGGEAQRTSLARAFAVRPEIIFLDEPFSSLDPPTREGLMDDLQRVLKETKTTTVMATHDRIEALRFSDRLAVMMSGKIVQIGPPTEVMNHPADEAIASFVGMETFLAGEVVKAAASGTVAVRVADGREIVAVGTFRPGEKVTCSIRPEQIAISTGTAPEDTSVRNVFPGTVAGITPLGLFYRVGVDCGFCATAFVTAPSLEELALEKGKLVYVSFKATAVHVFKTRGMGAERREKNLE